MGSCGSSPTSYPRGASASPAFWKSPSTCGDPATLSPSGSSGFFLNNFNNFAHEGHAFHELDQTPDDGDEAKEEDTVVSSQEVVELDEHLLQDLHEAGHQQHNAREEGKAWVFGQGHDVTGNKAVEGRWGFPLGWHEGLRVRSGM